MTELASFLSIRTIQDRVIGEKMIARITREVNQNLANWLYRSTGPDQVRDALTQYLVKEIKNEVGELPEGWESSVDQSTDILWEGYKKTRPDPIAGLIQMADDFTEYCHFSTIGGELIAEYVGPADLPWGDTHLNPERVHSLAAMVA
jgi:hypothetical protein